MPRLIQRLLFPQDPNATITQKMAEQELSPFLGLISEAVDDAFAEHLSGVAPATRRKMSPATRGAMVTNLIWESVRDKLTGIDDQIEICDKLGFFKVIFNGRIVVRFKRLDADRLARSQDSEQAKAWFANQPINGISDELLRVNFGYRPDSNWASCSEFYLTHQSSFRRIDWCTEFELVNETEDLLDASEPSKGHGLPEISIVARQNAYDETQAAK